MSIMNVKINRPTLPPEAGYIEVNGCYIKIGGNDSLIIDELRQDLDVTQAALLEMSGEVYGND